MNFNQTYKTMDLTIRSGAVPLIIGESGIGKTSLMKKYCEDNNLSLVNIDANLLKEGEIGGLPTIINNRTVYAKHHKLQEIDDLLHKSDRNVMLFIDEINRSDHAVQQELMNLILNREINGYKLSDRVIVTSAMNPSSRMHEFSDTDYQVVEMDTAQENRFVWLIMDSDPKEWLIWGMGEGDIHPKVIEFISNFENYLHYKSDKDFIEATPRSWERVSNALKVYKEKDGKDILYNFVKGNVGSSLAQDFISFIKENSESLIDFRALIEKEHIDDKTIEKIKKSSPSRQYILFINMVNFMENAITESKLRVENIERTAEILLLMPKDLRISLMKEIRKSHIESYKILIQNDTFLKAFFDAYE